MARIKQPAPTIEEYRARVETLLQEAAGAHYQVSVTQALDKVKVRLESKPDSPPTSEQASAVKNLLLLMGGVAARAEQPEEGATPPLVFDFDGRDKKLTDLFSRLSFAESYVKGHAIVHMMEIPAERIVMLQLMRDVVHPIVHVMRGDKDAIYDDSKIQATNTYCRYVKGDKKHGIKALAGSPLKAGRKINLYDTCLFGFLFDGDSECLQKLAASQTDFYSTYYEENPKRDFKRGNLYVSRDRIDPAMCSMQQLRSNSTPLEKLLNEEQNIRVKNALDAMWTRYTDEHFKKITPEIVFNAKPGALRGLLVNEEYAGVSEQAKACTTLRALYLREIFTDHYSNIVEKLYPNAKVLPVYNFDKNENVPFIKPRDLSRKTIESALASTVGCFDMQEAEEIAWAAKKSIEREKRKERESRVS